MFQGYNFKQLSSGVVERTFDEGAFRGETTLHQKAFSLVNKKSRKALSCVDGDSPRLIQEKYIKTSTSQQFQLNDKDQLVSVGCGGKIMTAMPTRSASDFECKSGIGMGFEYANDSPISRQQWRFYDYGIVNVACGRWSGNLTISSIEDYDTFEELPYKDSVTFSFINPFTRMAITAASLSSLLTLFQKLPSLSLLLRAFFRLTDLSPMLALVLW